MEQWASQVMQQAQQARRAQAAITRAYWDQRVMPTLHSAYRWMRESQVETGALEIVAEQWEQLWQHAQHIYGLHFMTNAGAYESLERLADLYESFTPDAKPSDALMLTQGLDGELQRVQSDLYRLSAQARALPAIATYIEAHRDASVDDLQHVADGAQWVNALQHFLDRHGHLGQAFEDVHEPSWTEEPARVIAEVRKRLLHPSADPETLRQQLAAHSDVLAEQTRARLQDQPDLLQKFAEALTLARDVGRLTEDHNYWIDRMLHAHARRFMLAVGERMTAAGMLAIADDIFYLHRGEVTDALRAPCDWRARVNERRSDHARWQTLQPPPRLGAPPPNAPVASRFGGPVNLENTADTLRGVGACIGVARGPARVVLSPNDFAKVQPNDILVCPASNPTWVPLFGIIAGLVTNTGGVLSHAAVVAREFGVPAVVGTGNATHVIRDGQLIEVDGSACVVRVLDEGRKTKDER